MDTNAMYAMYAMYAVLNSPVTDRSDSQDMYAGLKAGRVGTLEREAFRTAETQRIESATSLLIRNAKDGIPETDTMRMWRHGDSFRVEGPTARESGHLGEIFKENPEEAARILMTGAHAGQKDKLGVPYHHHPQGVHDLLVLSEEYAALPAAEKRDAECAAYLHDVVEDTDVSVDDLRRVGFSEGTLKAVDAISTREGEEKDAYYARVVAAGPVARALKLADLSHNNLACRRAMLPGAPGVPLKADDPKGGDMFTRLGKKYAKAYRALGADVPAHLREFDTL
jgi:hypothetical protein